MPTSKERGERVAKEIFGGLTTNPVRPHLASLVTREIDESAAEAIELVRQLADSIDPKAKRSRELFAVAKEFLAAHGVR